MSVGAKTETAFPQFLAVAHPSSSDQYRVVLVSADDLQESVERSLEEALKKMGSRPPARRSPTNVVKSAKNKNAEPASTKTLAVGAVDVTSISRSVVDKVNEAAMASMRQDPVRQTVADVLSRIHSQSVATHEAAVEENIRDLTEAFVTIYRNSGTGLRARQAMEEENARQRARFLTVEDTYTGPEVAALAGHTADNASATASRWKKNGRIFSINGADGERYPAFQFADGRPVPAVQELISVLRPQMSDWQIAFWLVSANSLLEGARPVDRLRDVEAVTAAALRERELLIT
jgi:hypothetical protein